MTDVEWIDPFELSLTGRFDIAAKFKYAEATAAGMLSDFHRRAYQEHIRTFNAFFEKRDSGEPKTSPSDFSHDFDQLLAKMSASGFDPEFAITLDPDSQAHDGAHRVAAALALNQKVAFRRSVERFSGKWGFEFFAERGMEPSHMDFAASALPRLFQNLRAVVLYGSAIGDAKAIEETLSNYGKVLYRKRIDLTRIGTANFIRVLYAGEPWLGKKEFGLLGAASKARPCFPESAPRAAIVLWFLPSVDNDAVVAAKEEARQHVGLGKHSLHITDRPEEIEALGDWLLDPNARHLLNHKSFRYLLGFERDFADLKRRLAEHPALRDNVCVVSSAVLAAYGARDSRDLDIIDSDDAAATLGLASSNDHWRRYGFDPPDLIRSPENHFVYRGIKFVSLARVAELKRKRGEAKDKIDLALIEEILPHPGGVTKKLARAALLFRLYANAKFLRSYAGHWLARVKHRLRLN